MTTLYMVNVTEYEFEDDWGPSVRPDGKAFCEDKETLLKFFSDLRETRDYYLYESIDTPRLVRVNEDSWSYFNLRVREDKVVWLRGESLKEFMEGVEF